MSAVDFFVNDASLHGQYTTDQAAWKAIVKLLSLVARLKEYGLHADRPRLFSADVVRGSSLSQLLARSPTDLERTFKIGLKEARVRTPPSSDDCPPNGWVAAGVGGHVSCDVAGSMMAIAGYLTLSGTCGGAGLLDFVSSRWSDFTRVAVEHSSLGRCELDRAESVEQLDILVPPRGPRPYTAEDRAPRDDETVLIDETRFRPLSHFNQGRRVWLGLQTEYRYCVDNGHFGAAAHLEVFDHRGRHVGVANLATGAIDRSGQVRGRRLGDR